LACVCVYIYIYIYIKNKVGSTGFRVDESTRFCRVKFLAGFYLNPAPGTGRLGPGSTRRAGPGFKTMDLRLFIDEGVVSGGFFLPASDKQHLYFTS